MEKYEATIKTDNVIELKCSEELDRLYTTIEADENFILQWEEKGVLLSEVIIATNISSKVKNGELILKSKEKKNENN